MKPHIRLEPLHGGSFMQHFRWRAEYAGLIIYGSTATEAYKRLSAYVRQCGHALPS